MHHPLVDHILHAVLRFQVVEQDAAIFLAITEVYKEQDPAGGEYVQPQSRGEPLRNPSLSITDQQYAPHLWSPPVLQTKNLRRVHALGARHSSKQCSASIEPDVAASLALSHSITCPCL